MARKIQLIVPMLVLCLSQGVQAQNLRQVSGPAELPPAGFGGAQYVDSAGCVFVRAGVNGNTVWVPRVTRSRKLVCGHRPSFPNVAQAAPTAAVAAPAQAPMPSRVPVIQSVRSTAAPARSTAVRVPTRIATVPAAKTAGVIPPGFREAWSDGRLNPDRGPRTDQGDAQMAMVWTNTVPRRLVAQK